MRSFRYSEKTIRAYSSGLEIFFGFLNNKKPEDVINKDLERFQKEFIIENNYSISFQSQIINAVKLFFQNQSNKKLDPELINRPRKPHILPNVLSKEEVRKILQAHGNIKHRTMLSLIYACGLRRSELLNLKPEDIQKERGLIIIRKGKGNKDRVVPLSEKLLHIIKEYLNVYQPVIYLFEGQNKGTKYSEQSIQSVLKSALKKAGIKKPVTLHWLRHSYATHLLESGTNLRYIQEILGHQSSRTTEIYTHVSNKNIRNIISPFDDL